MRLSPAETVLIFKLRRLQRLPEPPKRTRRGGAATRSSWEMDMAAARHDLHNEIQQLVVRIARGLPPEDMPTRDDVVAAYEEAAAPI